MKIKNHSVDIKILNKGTKFTGKIPTDFNYYPINF